MFKVQGLGSNMKVQYCNIDTLDTTIKKMVGWIYLMKQREGDEVDDYRTIKITNPPEQSKVL